MLVLAVGVNKFKSFKNIKDMPKVEKESNLQIKLKDFFSICKKVAVFMAIFITLIKLLRMFSELFLVGESAKFMNEEWKSKMRLVYYTDTNQLRIQDIGLEILQNILFFITIIIVSIPDGLLISAEIASALSFEKLLEKGVLVKDINSLESIGSLDRLVFDFTRGFTLNQINFDSCIINDNLFPIYNSRYIVPNLKLSEIPVNNHSTLLQCL